VHVPRAVRQAIAIAIVLIAAVSASHRGPGSFAPLPEPAEPSARASDPIDPNTATAAQLQALPGIGPTLARRIIAERAARPFSRVDDLRRVRGIGPRTLSRVGPRLRIAPTGRGGSSRPRSR
jgi:competence protein ComEA